MAAIAVDRAMEMFRARQRSTGQAGQVNPDVVQIEIHLECSNLANLDVMSKSDPVRFFVPFACLSLLSGMRCLEGRDTRCVYFYRGPAGLLTFSFATCRSWGICAVAFFFLPCRRDVLVRHTSCALTYVASHSLRCCMP